MKKILVIFGILAFSVCGFAAEKAGSVAAVEGRVEVVKGDAVMGKIAKVGSDLTLEDILRTKRKSFAEVNFVDGTSIKVFEKSRLLLNGIQRAKNGYNAEVQKGKVLFKVEKMYDVAGDFRIKTTNSIIGVKGTTIGVFSAGGITAVEVYAGHVELQPLPPAPPAQDRQGGQPQGGGQPGGEQAGAGQPTGQGGAVPPQGSGQPQGGGQPGGEQAGAGQPTGQGGAVPPQGSGQPQGGGTIGAVLNAGQGAVVGSTGRITTYQFGGSGVSQLFGNVGAVMGGASGGQGGAVDEGQLFNGLGGLGEGGLGGGSGEPGGSGGGLGDLAGELGNLLNGLAAGQGGTPGVPQELGDISDQVQEIIDNIPETQQQLEQSYGTVHINIVIE